MTVGGSLSYLKLSETACVAVNPKRIELVMLSWNRMPTDLSPGCHFSTFLNLSEGFVDALIANMPRCCWDDSSQCGPLRLERD